MSTECDKPEPKHSPSNKKLHYCEICSKTIVGGAYKYKCHLYNHKVIKPRFTCKHCSKEFFRIDAYQRHLSVHTRNYKKVFVCDYCDRYFVDKRNLVHHLKIHDDAQLDHPKIPSYKCPACGVTYTEERSLKYHVRKNHSNIQEPEYVKKPLNETWVERVMDSNVCVQVKKLNNNVISIKKCPSTDTENSQPKNALQKYLKMDNVDTTQYSQATCNYCNKVMLKKSLRLHIKERHLQVRRFSCDVCNRSFKRNYQLTNHMCGKQRKGPKPKTEISSDVEITIDMSTI